MNKTEQCGTYPITENMRAKQAAMYMGVGLSTVWLYSKQGKLTPIKLSDRVTIFRKVDLDNFINANIKAS